MKVTLIKPGLGDLIEGYNHKDGSMEPLSIAIIAALIKEPDEVVFYDDRLEDIPFDEPTNLVGITVDTFGAYRAYQIALEFRKRDVQVVLGGIHATLMPEEALNYCDAVIIGDAEPVWKHVMHDARIRKLQKIYQAEFRRPQERCFPRREIFKGKKYLPVAQIQFSRGCRFKCSFCAVSSYFNHAHHCRPVEDVLYEIDKDNLKTILFVDDNMVANRQQVKLFLRELAPMKVRWAAQTSIDMVNDRELMQLMADSGCIGNLIGFESINIHTLEWFAKSPNLRDFNDYREALKILRDYGFLTWASFMLGNDFDTPGTIEKTVEFSMKNKFALSFFHILMPYPKTEIYHQFEREGRLLFGGKWWLEPSYRYNQAAFVPRLMSPETLSEATIRANKEFYSTGSIVRRMFDFRTNMRNMVNFLIYSRFNYVLRNTSI